MRTTTRSQTYLRICSESVSGQDLLEVGMRKAEGMMAMKMAGGGLAGKLVSTTLAVFQGGVENGSSMGSL